jgi:nuclear transport factor 2 (NTF2) superfamily protein
MITSETARPPVSPFDRNAAIKKVRLAEDAWNTRDSEKVASGYRVWARLMRRVHQILGGLAL